MTSKIHNKTLFVAALSVYFGLLVVGAPQQTLAQINNTLNPSFQELERILKQESEIESVKALDASETIEKLAEFFRDFSLKNAEKSFFAALEKSDYGCTGDSNWRKENLGSAELLNSLSKYFNDLDKSANFLTCYLRFCQLYTTRDREIAVGFNQNELKVQISAKFDLPEGDQEARLIADELQQVFLKFAAAETNVNKLQIYAYTQTFAENNQVFIITRLPRAALDSLFSASEKAD